MVKPPANLVCLALGLAAVVTAPLGLLQPADANLTPSGDQFRADPETNTTPPSRRTLTRFSDGTFVVVYRDNSGYPNNGIWVQRYDANGAQIGTRAVVSTEPGYSYPSVAARDDRSFIVVWPTAHPSSGVAGQRMDTDASAIGTAFYVSGGSSEHRNLDIKSFPDGSFVVVWDSYYTPFVTGFNTELVGQRFDSNAAAVGGPFHVNTYTTDYQQNASVAAGSDGRFVVVWQSQPSYGSIGQDGSYTAVVGQRFNSDASRAGTEFVVNTFTTYAEDSPDVAMHSDGSFVVVWHTQYGDDNPQIGISDSVTFRRYAASGSPIGDEFHLNSYVTGAQRNPVIAMDDDGSFVVAFESHSTYNEIDERDDGEAAGLFARCFDTNGLPVGEDFHVNAYTTGNQITASIATDGSGNFVIGWHGAVSGDYGYGFTYPLGIAVRRFSRGGSGLSGVCADPIDPPPGGSGLTAGRAITATDALFVLQAAVQIVTCPSCVCDVNGVGGITATDSLLTLQSAVGQQIPLNCPACT